MKKLLGILALVIFTLQTPSQADDIRDFQIEGMSVGDSALDYFSKREIENGTTTLYPKSKDFFTLSILNSKSDTYDQFSFHLKKDDKNYIIYSISGDFHFENDIKGCNIKKKEIVDELNSVFKNLKQENYDYEYLELEDGKSVAAITDFIFDDRSAVRVYCIDWSKVTEKNRDFVDMLSVDISPRSVLVWLEEEAY